MKRRLKRINRWFWGGLIVESVIRNSVSMATPSLPTDRCFGTGSLLIGTSSVDTVYLERKQRMLRHGRGELGTVSFLIRFFLRIPT